MMGYETTLILKPEVTDDTQKAIVEKMKGIITAHGGELIHLENWGRRKLAYPIQKETRGTYIFMIYTGNSSLVAELERNVRINEQIMRHLSVKFVQDYEAEKFKKPVTPMTQVAHAPAAHSEYMH